MSRIGLLHYESHYCYATQIGMVAVLPLMSVFTISSTATIINSLVNVILYPNFGTQNMLNVTLTDIEVWARRGFTLEYSFT